MEKESQMTPVNTGLTPADAERAAFVEFIKRSGITAFDATKDSWYWDIWHEAVCWANRRPPPPGLTTGEAADKWFQDLETIFCALNAGGNVASGRITSESCAEQMRAGNEAYQRIFQTLQRIAHPPKAPPDPPKGREWTAYISQGMRNPTFNKPYHHIQYETITVREVPPPESETAKPTPETIPDQWCPNCEYLMEDKPTPATMDKGEGAKAKCQVLTSSGPGEVELHLCGLEIPLSLGNAMRLSRGLNAAVEEMAGVEAAIELSRNADESEDYNPWELDHPIHPGSSVARSTEAGGLEAVAEYLRALTRRERPSNVPWDELGNASKVHWRTEAQKVIEIASRPTPVDGTPEAGK